MSIFIGCASWGIPHPVQAHFPVEGSHLERYAAVFPAVEINTSFYRPHLPVTYARWYASVPPAFRFSVKVPRTMTHQLRLRDIEHPLKRFLDEVGNLHEKLGCLLVQLPPSLRYDTPVAEQFFSQLRAGTMSPVACEARHASWFTPAAGAMLTQWNIARVSADPPVAETPERPDDSATVYMRLHGSPVVYYSAYPEAYLTALSEKIAEHDRAGRDVWCIFDNTAGGAAVPDALSLMARCCEGSSVRKFS